MCEIVAGDSELSLIPHVCNQSLSLLRPPQTRLNSPLLSHPMSVAASFDTLFVTHFVSHLISHFVTSYLHLRNFDAKKPIV